MRDVEILRAGWGEEFIRSIGGSGTMVAAKVQAGWGDAARMFEQFSTVHGPLYIATVLFVNR